MTYTFANAVPGGWVGVVCSDAGLMHRLYESATVCMTEMAAEMTAADEHAEAVGLVREMERGAA